MKRIFVTLLIFLVIGGLGYAAYTYWPEETDSSERALRSGVAEKRDLRSTITTTGEVRPSLNSAIKSEISGRIAELFVEEGDLVEKSDPIVRIDPTSLEAQVRESERALAADRLRVERAERDFQRFNELFQRQFVGEQQQLDSKTDYELAQINLEIAEARLEKAREDLAKTTILAPHDGMITVLNVLEGEVISGATSFSNGTEIAAVAKLDQLYLRTTVNEVDISKLSTGQQAQVRFDAFPDLDVKGTIEFISPSAQTINGVRGFPIEVIFSAQDGRIRPGISATAEIVLDSAEDAVSILLSGVYKDEDQSIVFVKKDDLWQRRVVEVGINNLQHVAIVSGLEVGETVALNRPSDSQLVTEAYADSETP